MRLFYTFVITIAHTYKVTTILVNCIKVKHLLKIHKMMDYLAKMQES